jgi:hypothetical protein
VYKNTLGCDSTGVVVVVVVVIKETVIGLAPGFLA